MDTKIAGNRIVFNINNPLKFMRSNSFYVEYDTDISNVPKHIFCYMFGVVMSEILSWNEGHITFDELTINEFNSIKNHVEMNRKANPYDRVSKTPIDISVDRLVRSDTNPKEGNSNLCCNGMGKDGIAVVCMVDEVLGNALPFTVGNQYKNEDLFNERKDAMEELYRNKVIRPGRYIDTNFMRNSRYKTIPWWVFGIPLAYSIGSKNIFFASDMGDNKIRVEDGAFLRPNMSIASSSDISSTTKMLVEPITLPITTYGAQKLLVERYPETLDYQRSCMFGHPWCNACSECYKISKMLETLSENPERIGIKPSDRFRKNVKNSEPNLMTRSMVIELNRKLSGNFYGEWIEGLNTEALKWVSCRDKFMKIFREHFKFYDEDVGEDGFGYEQSPSKWRNIVVR